MDEVVWVLGLPSAQKLRCRDTWRCRRGGRLMRLRRLRWSEQKKQEGKDINYLGRSPANLQKPRTASFRAIITKIPHRKTSFILSISFSQQLKCLHPCMIRLSQTWLNKNHTHLTVAPAGTRNHHRHKDTLMPAKNQQPPPAVLPPRHRLLIIQTENSSHVK